ncbi:hypothetical protein V498_03087 [Pseudogymnoascus sp. VKM F-4517 (FW-2822)]|nr:hypothetical protein V498_03087 [Pseudogymnoascus sp. VKM F-4517 (FW-2822)]
MKFQAIIVSALAAVAAAAPHPSANEAIDGDALPAIMARQSSSSDDLKNGACKEVTFIFARGSTEAGNMGTIIGPQVCTALKTLLGSSKVACQGVGSPYEATLADNFLPKNTSPTAIGAANTMFNLAHTKCPNTKVVTGGYSQGSAVVDNSIQALDAAVVAQIKGVVLFGFTRNLQDRGRIPGYPTSQTKVFCAIGDLVCDGTLIITAAHLTYGINASSAARFLASKV